MHAHTNNTNNINTSHIHMHRGDFQQAMLDDIGGHRTVLPFLTTLLGHLHPVETSMAVVATKNRIECQAPVRAG